MLKRAHGSDGEYFLKYDCARLFPGVSDALFELPKSISLFPPKLSIPTRPDIAIAAESEIGNINNLKKTLQMAGKSMLIM